MASDAAADVCANIDTAEPDTSSDNICLNDIVSLSSNGARMEEPGNAGEILTRVELDVAYCSEKLLNLDILLMEVSARQNEGESLVINNDSEESVEKWLEFDLSSGILESELTELNNFMVSLQTEITFAHQRNSSREHFKGAFIEIEDKLQDCEETLKQSQNQLVEMKVQFAKLQRTLSTSLGQENGNNQDENSPENGQFSDPNTKLKLQTVEQQKHILRMLEKSLARELDMEKKLCESRNTEEELRKKLHFAEQNLIWMEEETEVVTGMMFEAENGVEVLKGISKELLGRIQLLEFNLNGYIRREGDMRCNLQDSTEQIRNKENSLSKVETSSSKLDNFHLTQTNTLQATQKETEDLKGNIAKEESSTDHFASKCTVLTETNMQLSEELDSLRSRSLENVNSLEKKLTESNIQLQHAKASAEASQEQQNMLYSAIDDMENLIEDLKSRVSKAESRAEKAEAKCSLLSETNLEINEELAFLRSRMECLEISLNQADDEKIITAKDINIRSAAISDLVLQLARERERLQNLVSSLVKENEALAAKSGQVSTVTMKQVPDFAKAEEAVAESSISTFQAKKSCFECGDFGHWRKDCQWLDYPCVNGGSHKMKLYWSLREGKRFVSCFGVDGCEGFKWVDNDPQLDNITNIKGKGIESSEYNVIEGKLKVSIEGKLPLSVEGGISDVCEFVKLLSF